MELPNYHSNPSYLVTFDQKLPYIEPYLPGEGGDLLPGPRPGVQDLRGGKEGSSEAKEASGESSEAASH